MAEWRPEQLELEDPVLETPDVLDAVPACVSISDCNVTCTLNHLKVVEFSSKDYNCQVGD